MNEFSAEELKEVYEDRASAVLQNLEYENIIKRLMEENKRLKDDVKFWKNVASTADQM